MELRCGSWKVMENNVFSKVQNKLSFFAKKINSKDITKMEGDFQENGQI